MNRLLHKTATILMFSFLCASVSLAQGVTYAQPIKNVIAEPNPLKVGDKMPSNIVLQNVVNSPTNTLRLSSTNKKLTILDFWATWCGLCIEGIYKAEQLEQHFKNQIQFILVNEKVSGDNEARINSFFENRRQRTGQAIPLLPSVLKDTLLSKLFPHTDIPHYVWIDSTNTIIAITSNREITQRNIQAVLEGNAINMRMKGIGKGWLTAHDIISLFHTNDKSNDIFRTALPYPRFFTGFKDGYSGESSTVIDEGKSSSLIIFNSTLQNLIIRGYNDSIGKIPQNRWIYNVRNSDQFRSEYGDSLAYTYSYCYGVKVPVGLENIQLQLLKEDLKTVFNINVSVQTRKIKCISIVPNDTLFESLSPIEQSIDIEKETLNKHITNTSLGEALMVINEFSKTPLIVSSKFSSLKITIKLPYTLNNQPELMEALKSAGLKLNEVIKEMPVVLISDK